MTVITIHLPIQIIQYAYLVVKLAKLVVLAIYNQIVILVMKKITIDINKIHNVFVKMAILILLLVVVKQHANHVIRLALLAVQRVLKDVVPVIMTIKREQ